MRKLKNPACGTVNLWGPITDMWYLASHTGKVPLHPKFARTPLGGFSRTPIPEGFPTPREPGAGRWGDIFFHSTRSRKVGGHHFFRAPREHSLVRASFFHSTGSRKAGENVFFSQHWDMEIGEASFLRSGRWRCEFLRSDSHCLRGTKGGAYGTGRPRGITMKNGEGRELVHESRAR